MTTSDDTLAKRLSRAEARVEALERLLESKTRELFAAVEQAESSRAQLAEVFRTTPAAIFVCTLELEVEKANAAAGALVASEPDSLAGRSLATLLGTDDMRADAVRKRLVDADGVARINVTCRTPNVKEPIPIVASMSRMEAPTARIVVACLDMRREAQLELELRHAQKLEAVGQLAAGVAHEINTPIQFVGDSLYFLRDSFGDLVRLGRGECSADEADLDYLSDEVPQALERCEQGLGRVGEIVRALKAFAHPGGDEKAPADLNVAVKNAVTVAQHATKQYADVELRLGQLPLVPCLIGDVGQVVLNLLVNAAHAIEDKLAGTKGKRGRIIISTMVDGDMVELSVADDGGGIPEHVQPRLFEPFFTTKAVGRGTGQGLPISRTIVVDRHHGSLTFDTALGVGTTFHVRLPLRLAAREAA